MTAQHPVKTPKKLIEVALPLDAINAAAAAEKTIRHGHVSNLHRWWARRPLAAARAVIFGQMVNDPSWKWELEHPGEVPPNNLKASWAASRKRLFNIIEDLVKWENTANEEVLEKARTEIRKSWRETCELNKAHPNAAELFSPETPPPVYDPFAGGGALPLEAQRLGLQACASDLNPVAVLVNKAMIEIPPRFSALPPVNPDAVAEKGLIDHGWKGTAGLAEDVRYYGQWMRDEALKRVGHLYPPVEITVEMAKDRPDLEPMIGQKLTVIAWIWARTVKSPNPAFHQIHVPLVSSFVLSTKQGKEAYLEPLVDGAGYRFTVTIGKPPEEAYEGTKLARANFRCLLSGAPISGDYIKTEAQAGRMGTTMLAIVAEGTRGRVYLPASPVHEHTAREASPTWRPDVTISGTTQYLGCKPYGMERFSDIFTNRQLVALTTLCDLVGEVRERVLLDAAAAGMGDDDTSLEQYGNGSRAYADAVATYLGLIVSKTADSNNALCPWEPVAQCSRQLFGRQAISMMWDFAEANPLHDSSGGFTTNIRVSCQSFPVLPGLIPGRAFQKNAMEKSDLPPFVVVTDPPYYDNVPYADISDFFHVWLRKALRPVFPSLLATIATPKAEELVAFAYRHGGKEGAEAFFLDGMTKVAHVLSSQAHPAFPLTLYYAFRQAETTSDAGTVSTGWVTFLESLLRAGLIIAGTWPIRTESTAALKAKKNALASSVVLACLPRSSDAPTVSRRAFLRELNQVLPEALDEMTKGSGDEQSPVAPVDLSQAIIGPGMAVFSKYTAVLEADGTPMSVRTALQLINRFLAEDDFDRDTQFCLHWFEQHGWNEGKYGDAETLARAKGTAVDGVKDAGVLFASAGVVRLLKWVDYPADWDPTTDSRLPVWEALHQIIRVFKTEGESAAGVVIAEIQDKAESVRQLAYRLYTLCERAGWADDARAYNEIITSWNAIESAAAVAPAPQQTTLFG